MSELPDLPEFIAYGKKMNPDIGPMFGRDAARVGEAYLELERRHERLLNLGRRVSNSFIATQDRFGVERRRLLWALRDEVSNQDKERQ